MNNLTILNQSSFFFNFLSSYHSSNYFASHINIYLLFSVGHRPAQFFSRLTLRHWSYCAIVDCIKNMTNTKQSKLPLLFMLFLIKSIHAINTITIFYQPNSKHFVTYHHNFQSNTDEEQE